MPNTSLLLFDVDGVIVNPLAYRAGISTTLRLLYDRIALPNIDALLPSEAEISRLESVGVHDVWDATNIIFASVLASIALKSDGSVPFGDNSNLPGKLAAIAAVNPQAAKPSIEQIALVLAQNPSAHPPDVILKLLRADLAKTTDREHWFSLLESFLCGTRNPYESYGTRLFQNIILGTSEFTSTYGLDSEYDGDSLLKQKDQVLISEDSLQKLHKLRNSDQSDVRIGVYTARPSHPPDDAADATRGYSPEAELALASAQMTCFPLVGMGMMEWLANQKNERTEDLTKPNTTQAVAALIACCGGETNVAVLREAYAIDKQNKHPAETSLAAIGKSPLTVYVFEDTISGILPMLATAKKLNQQGFSIEVIPLGIAQDAKKRESLEKHCSKIFDNVNAAIDFAAQSISN